MLALLASFQPWNWQKPPFSWHCQGQLGRKFCNYPEMRQQKRVLPSIQFFLVVVVIVGQRKRTNNRNGTVWISIFRIRLELSCRWWSGLMEWVCIYISKRFCFGKSRDNGFILGSIIYAFSLGEFELYLVFSKVIKVFLYASQRSYLRPSYISDTAFCKTSQLKRSLNDNPH